MLEFPVSNGSGFWASLTEDQEQKLPIRHLSLRLTSGRRCPSCVSSHDVEQRGRAGRAGRASTPPGHRLPSHSRGTAVGLAGHRVPGALFSNRWRALIPAAISVSPYRTVNCRLESKETRMHGNPQLDVSVQYTVATVFFVHELALFWLIAPCRENLFSDDTSTHCPQSLPAKGQKELNKAISSEEIRGCGTSHGNTQDYFTTIRPHISDVIVPCACSEGRGEP